MFFWKLFAIFTCIILAVSESAFVDTLTKCSIHDGDCQAALINSSLKVLQKTGAPELGIPPIDPLEFEDLSITILNMIKLTAVNGKVKGIRNCVADSMKTDIKKGHSVLQLSCTSLDIKAKYVVNGSNPLIKNLLGGESVHGEGNAKMKFEKIRFKIEYYYNVVKHSDGDLYFTWTFNKTIYQYDVPGKVTIAADKIFIGQTDATPFIIGLLNSNANIVVAEYGKLFMDKAMEFVYKYTHNFIKMVPIKYYIIEDLSEYIKK